MLSRNLLSSVALVDGAGQSRYLGINTCAKLWLANIVMRKKRRRRQHNVASDMGALVRCGCFQLCSLVDLCVACSNDLYCAQVTPGGDAKQLLRCALDYPLASCCLSGSCRCRYRINGCSALVRSGMAAMAWTPRVPCHRRRRFFQTRRCRRRRVNSTSCSNLKKIRRAGISRLNILLRDKTFSHSSRIAEISDSSLYSGTIIHERVI